MLTQNSRSRSISWQELDEMIVTLSKQCQHENIWPQNPRSQIPSIMLQHQTGGIIDVNGKRFNIFSDGSCDICLFKVFFEDEAMYSPWDGIFYEEIIIPIDEQPPLITMPWERV